MAKMMRKLFLLLLLAVASAHAVLHVTPAWASDDGGGDDSDGGADAGDGTDGGDAGSASDGSSSDGSSSDGGTSAESGGEDGGSGGSEDPEVDDQERARAGRLSGNFLPLDAILEKVRRRYPGTVLKVRLRYRGDTAYYEIRILDREDRLRTVSVPAGPRRKGNWTSRR